MGGKKGEGGSNDGEGKRWETNDWKGEAYQLSLIPIPH